MPDALVCLPKSLPKDQWIQAAETASTVNPVNHPPVERLMGLVPGFKPKPEHIAVLTTRYWGPGGVKLTVGFLDNPAADLRKRILLHMNAWSNCANVSFVETATDPEVRISRMGGADGGYWSYLGTDIKHIPAGQPTLNLEGFTMDTPESEFHRVVRHETGHTIGCPHEHMRAELIAKIDRQKAIAFFMQTQGWSEHEVVEQVLTPISERSLLGTPHADRNSIMCYEIPGKLTVDGQAIVGGTDITKLDCSFMGGIYPKQHELAETATGPA